MSGNVEDVVTIKGVFFVTFPTGILGVPLEAVFLATFRAADEREFHVETANPKSNPRQAREQTRKYGGAHG